MDPKVIKTLEGGSDNGAMKSVMKQFSAMQAKADEDMKTINRNADLARQAQRAAIETARHTGETAAQVETLNKEVETLHSGLVRERADRATEAKQDRKTARFWNIVAISIAFASFVVAVVSLIVSFGK